MRSESQIATLHIEESPRFTSSPFEPSLPPITSLNDVDLTDPELLRCGDPHATWRVLRDQAPVFWHEKGARGTRGQGFWAVTTHAECSEVHRLTSVFSNTQTEFMDLLPEDIPNNLSSMDPPEHAKYRGILRAFFTGKAINARAEHVRALITAILDEAEQVKEFNFHDQIAQRVPLLATAALLDISPEDTMSLAMQLGALDYGGQDPLAAYTRAVMDFFDDLTRDWKRGEHDSIVGAVVDADIDGAPIDRADALAYLWVLFTGALDTTAHAATIGLLSLFHHPDQLELLRRDPSLATGAVTEMLRWTATSNVVKHVALTDHELAGVPIKAGDFIATYPPSANRDERVFADPFRFDLTRRADAPLFTFGGGPHLCLGHLFARMELGLLFEELFTRFPDLEQAGPAVRGEAFTMTLSPLNELPVRLR
ncbi:cytochrome P450 [Sporichthya sp.]|uniref:cytochrome P450 n=1 Tax=Sporichthya sp. TaxID=65475 RepID=UPI001857F312|nr:cytochrome P450 [Sporichthya sp.]MBA3741549.1 cytochrome P450 [Sporichthya sp.]